MGYMINFYKNMTDECQVTSVVGVSSLRSTDSRTCVPCHAPFTYQYSLSMSRTQELLDFCFACFVCVCVCVWCACVRACVRVCVCV